MQTNQMRYIKTLRLINFQSHKDTEIELQPGINLITGTSNAGKSAILRGLNFLFHNEPRGKSFIRFGTDEVFVSAVFNDGYEITRVKGDSRNAVLITTPDGVAKSYERIGDKLPQEALEILGNPPIDKEHGPLSYAEQLSPYFLAGLTPTELPRAISELTGIDDFEEAARRLSAEARRSDVKAKDSANRIETYTADLEQYSQLDNRLTYLAKLEQQAEKVDAISQMRDDAVELQSRYTEIYNIGRQVADSLSFCKKISVMGPELMPIVKLKEDIENAKKIYESAEEINSVARGLKNTSTKSKMIQEQSNLDIEFDAMEVSENLFAINRLYGEYQDVMSSAQRIRSDINVWKKEQQSAEEDYNSITQEMKSKGMWCDNCQRPMLDKTVTCH